MRQRNIDDCQEGIMTELEHDFPENKIIGTQLSLW